MPAGRTKKPTKAGLLITGTGGAGKSTTALACVSAGLGYTADDYCMASIGKERMLYSVFGTEVLARHLLPALARRGHEQVVVAAHGDHSLPDRSKVDG